MASCMFVSASLVLTLAFIASGIAFFAPFWRSQNGTDSGLWGECSAGNCKWFWENDYTRAKGQPDWFKASMALYGVGFLIVFVTEIYSRLQLCCDIRPSMSRSAGFLLIAAFILMGVAVGLYGGMMDKDHNTSVKMSGGDHFGWAFWMAASGCILTLLSAILFSCISGVACGEKV
eukprot:GHVO01012246.1.p1 GENE.GHVO01012246.1~~GHVO01012246.1.p1  ORF type:complete len:175 (-),score=10.81 GHVO01012246.1:234-758(-)